MLCFTSSFSVTSIDSSFVLRELLLTSNLTLDSISLEEPNKGLSGSSSPLKWKVASLTCNLLSPKRSQTAVAHVQPPELRPQADLPIEAGHMGPQDSPRRNDGVKSPIEQGRYAQGSAKRYGDRRPSGYNESIDHGVSDTGGPEHRSRSRERRSPVSASYHHITNRDLSPTDRGDIRMRGANEWNSRSPSDFARERRTRGAEQYLISRGFKDPKPVSGRSPDERSRQHQSPDSSNCDRAKATGAQNQNSAHGAHSDVNRGLRSPSHLSHTSDMANRPLNDKEPTLDTQNLSFRSSSLHGPRLDAIEQAINSRSPSVRASPVRTVQLDNMAHTQETAMCSSQPKNEVSNKMNMITDSRAKIRDVLMRFMSEVTEQASLQLRSDSARQALERRVIELEKVQRVHKDFASAAEAVQASKDRAQKEFDELAKQLSNKRAASISLVEEIADSWIPNNKDGASQVFADVEGRIQKIESQIKHIESSMEVLHEKYDSSQADYSAFKSRNQELDQLVGKSMKTTETQINTIKATTGNLFEGVQNRLSDYDRRLSSLAVEISEQKKAKEIVSIKSKVDSLSTRVDSFPNLRIEISKATTEINNTLAAQAQNVQELSSKVDETARSIGARVEGSTLGELAIKIHDLSARMDGFRFEELMQDHKNQAQEIKRLKMLLAAEIENQVHGPTAEALSKLQSTLAKVADHVAIIEKDLKITDGKVGPEDLHTRIWLAEQQLGDIADKVRAIIDKPKIADSGPIQRISPARESNSTSTRSAPDDELPLRFEKLQRELQTELRKELRDTQVAGDEQWGNIINDFAGRIAKFDSSINALKGDYGEQLLGVSRDMDHLKESSTAELASIRNTIASNHSLFVAQHGHHMSVIQGLETKVDGLETSILNDIESVNLAVTNLDYRMNNLTTESLAKLILGHLEAHMRNNDASLPRLDLRIQALEKNALNDRANLSEKVRREILDVSNAAVQTAKDSLHETNLALEAKVNSLQVDVTHLRAIKEELSAMKAVSLATETTLKDVNASVKDVTDSLHDVATEFDEVKAKLRQETSLLRDEINVVDSSLASVTKDLETTKASFEETTRSLRAEMLNNAVPQSFVATEKRKLKSTGLTRSVITQQRAITVDKRRSDASLSPKVNGRKRRKAPDSDDNDFRPEDDDYAEFAP